MMAGEAEPYESSPVFQADIAGISAAIQEERKSSRYDPRVLHEAVRVTAMHARQHQCPPERLLRALKALMRELSMQNGSLGRLFLSTSLI